MYKRKNKEKKQKTKLVVGSENLSIEKNIPKQVSVENSAEKEKEVVCEYCDYTRKEYEPVPDWQCPSCEVPYSYSKENSGRKKVYPESDSMLDQVSLKKRNMEYLSRKKLEVDNKGLRSITGQAGIFAGLWMFMSGLPSACIRAASNPILLVAGAVIAVGSISYLIYKFGLSWFLWGK